MKRRGRKRSPLAWTLALTAMSAAAWSEPLAVTVTVDETQVTALIDRDVYGQFAEHKGTLIYGGVWVGQNSKIPNTRGIRNDVVAALRKIHVPIVRWPGGCFADAYHWRDGIGAPEHRPRRPGVYSGQIESNQFGTHEFMDFLDQVGAKAYIGVNVGSGSVQEAKDWLEYMTAPVGTLADLRRQNGRSAPWKVKYVGIGNEMYECGGSMSADYYVDHLRRYSHFLSYDPASGETRYLIASGGEYAEWAKALMQNMHWKAPDTNIQTDSVFFNGLSLHHYTHPEGVTHPTPAIGFSEDQWLSVLKSPSQLDEILTRRAALMDEYDPGKKVALVVDEWGAWYAPQSTRDDANWQQNSLRDALLAALTFNVFHRHSDRVRMANISMLVNVFQAMILTDGEKMLLTPTYYAFDLYQPFQGATPYRTTVSGPNYELGGARVPAVDASAARGTDGKIYLALVNLDPHRSAKVTTNMRGMTHGRLLTAPYMDSHNTFAAPDVVHPTAFSSRPGLGAIELSLPAKSVAVIAIEERSKRSLPQRFDVHR